MITTILRTALTDDLEAARFHTAARLHVPIGDVTRSVAVAYIINHFEQGSYSGWDGWLAMRQADRIPTLEA